MQTPIAHYRSSKRQTEWDRLLIEGWRANWRMGRIMHAFLAGTEDDGCKDILGAMATLHRAPRNARDLVCPVKVFIGNRLRPMSDVLFDGRSDDYVLEFLKCKRIDTDGQWVKPTGRRKARYGAVSRTVSARDNDKSHDWKTVK